METLNELENVNGVGWGKCIAGTVGSAILGGLSGAGKTIVFGPYAIAGGVGGGLVGATSSC